MPKTLLLADDSVTIQKVVGLSFASEDVVLVTVSNGDDALLRAREVSPDLVLADVVMPGKNGYEVCEALKADPALRHIPVLLLTGTFEAFDQERARRAGADGHVTKPFEAQALVQQVKDLMERAAKPAGFEPAAPPPAQPGASILQEAPVVEPVRASDPIAPQAASTHPFFEEELSGSAPVGEELLDLDPDAAAGELELSTVAEDESGADDLLGGPDLAPLPASDVAGAPEVVDDFPAAHETFRGTPLFAPAVTESDALSPRAAAPVPANLLPEDDFDLGFDEPPFATSVAAAPPAAPAPVPSANLFAEEDPAEELIVDPGRAEGFDLSFSDLDDPLAAAGDEAEAATVLEPALAPVSAPPAAPVAPPPLEGARSGSGAGVPITGASGSGAGLPVDLSPVLRERLHDTLEKIAWEAFADLSDTIVRQALARIETIAWEVIPQMAEQLVREEIRRMKGDPEAS